MRLWGITPLASVVSAIASRLSGQGSQTLAASAKAPIIEELSPESPAALAWV